MWLRTNAEIRDIGILHSASSNRDPSPGHRNRSGVVISRAKHHSHLIEMILVMRNYKNVTKCLREKRDEDIAGIAANEDIFVRQLAFAGDLFGQLAEAA